MSAASQIQRGTGLFVRRTSKRQNAELIACIETEDHVRTGVQEQNVGERIAQYTMVTKMAGTGSMRWNGGSGEMLTVREDGAPEPFVSQL